MEILNWKSKFHKELKSTWNMHQLIMESILPRQYRMKSSSFVKDSLEKKIESCIQKYWSLMADETQDCSTTEQLSMCVRYVNDVGEIFLALLNLRKWIFRT